MLGATLSCPFGLAPSNLVVLPNSRVMIENKPAATIMDFAPMANIPPFGMCTSMVNPLTIAATAAASGVPTPGACVPVTTPWKPGVSKTMIGSLPALDVSSTCQCAYGGVITVVNPGTTKEIYG